MAVAVDFSLFRLFRVRPFPLPAFAVSVLCSFASIYGLDTTRFWNLCFTAMPGFITWCCKVYRSFCVQWLWKTLSKLMETEWFGLIPLSCKLVYWFYVAALLLVLGIRFCVLRLQSGFPWMPVTLSVLVMFCNLYAVNVTALLICCSVTALLCLACVLVLAIWTVVLT